jgi:hypothetical protein
LIKTKWDNTLRSTSTYDSLGRITEEITEKWNGKKWNNFSKNEFQYERFFQEIATYNYDWNSKGSIWILGDGSRKYLDTLDKKGNRLYLENLTYDKVNKKWEATDSTFYDNKKRIEKTVSKNRDSSSMRLNTNETIETCDYYYQSDNVWIETYKTYTTNSKGINVERLRYRKKNDGPTIQYAVDYWDSQTNRWIPNTAQLYRKYENGKIVLDSMEEVINDKSIPVYLYTEMQSIDGQLTVQRYWKKSFDEKTNKWKGSCYKSESRFDKSSGTFYKTDSTFVAHEDGQSWILSYFEKEDNSIPSRFYNLISGEFKDSLGQWEYSGDRDTVTSCGIKLNIGQYFNEQKMCWLPEKRFTTSKNGDTLCIISQLYDFELDDWENVSMMSVLLGVDSLVKERIDWNWTRSMLNGKWEQTKKISYNRIPVSMILKSKN